MKDRDFIWFAIGARNCSSADNLYISANQARIKDQIEILDWGTFAVPENAFAAGKSNWRKGTGVIVRLLAHQTHSVTLDDR